MSYSSVFSVENSDTTAPCGGFKPVAGIRRDGVLLSPPQQNKAVTGVPFLIPAADGRPDCP